ncbi:MAG: hypothetical protein L0229_05365, partial [Blastocatellia bacterium]|nr:hypothetical protein [Blastocatellia bacterium]
MNTLAVPEKPTLEEACEGKNSCWPRGVGVISSQFVPTILAIHIGPEEMALACDYCRSACDEDALKCESCGAPIDLAVTDFRSCPYCRRRLLTLASPACNYCSRRLPEKFLKARESDLRRIKEKTEIDGKDAVNVRMDELIRQTARQSRNRADSISDLFDISDFTDL